MTESRQSRRRSTCPGFLAFVVLAAASVGELPAQSEVPGLDVTDVSTIVWAPAAGADYYNICSGTAGDLAAGSPPRCHTRLISGASGTIDDEVEEGSIPVYLVTGETNSGLEGPICRKTLANLDDPTAPCISSYWLPTPAGEEEQ